MTFDQWWYHEVMKDGTILENAHTERRMEAARMGWEAAQRYVNGDAQRWQALEKGAQWVSWTPICGETHSFDPRHESHRKDMRSYADALVDKVASRTCEGEGI